MPSDFEDEALAVSPTNFALRAASAAAQIAVEYEQRIARIVSAVELLCRREIDLFQRRDPDSSPPTSPRSRSRSRIASLISRTSARVCETTIADSPPCDQPDTRSPLRAFWSARLTLDDRTELFHFSK